MGLEHADKVDVDCGCEPSLLRVPGYLWSSPWSLRPGVDLAPVADDLLFTLMTLSIIFMIAVNVQLLVLHWPAVYLTIKNVVGMWVRSSYTGRSSRGREEKAVRVGLGEENKEERRKEKR